MNTIKKRTKVKPGVRTGERKKNQIKKVRGEKGDGINVMQSEVDALQMLSIRYSGRMN